MTLPRLLLTRIGLFLLPVAAALVLNTLLLAPMREEREAEVTLRKLRAPHALDLEAAFAAAGYGWPPADTVPRVAVRHLPRDLDALPVESKKALFFRLTLPLVAAENERVQRQRQVLLALFAQGALAHESRAYRLARRIAVDYGVTGDLNAPAVRALLLRRVDTIPVALALAQAADESAWGTSRFAREGNSLFGEWTWIRGEGLVPLRRVQGKGHLVRSFGDLRHGVRAYFYNLNAGHAYGVFRHLRERMRRSGRPFDPLILAAGLERYSERGDEYVEEIRALIRDNGLLHLDEELRLQPI